MSKLELQIGHEYQMQYAGRNARVRILSFNPVYNRAHVQIVDGQLRKNGQLIGRDELLFVRTGKCSFSEVTG